MGWSVPPVTRRFTPPIISASSSLCVIPEHSDTGLKHLAAVSQGEQGYGRELTAGKRATEAPLLSLLVRKELTLGREGGQTLGSMVTECVINAAMCPVPRTFSTSGPFLRHWKNRRGQQQERGVSGAPLCHCICPEKGYHLQLGLRRMTLVNHEVMVEERLVSDDGCVEGEDIS